MAKDIRLESFKYHFLQALQRTFADESNENQLLLDGLSFEREPSGVRVTLPASPGVSHPVNSFFEFADFTFYQKGDSASALVRQARAVDNPGQDTVQLANATSMDQAVARLMAEAGSAVMDNDVIQNAAMRTDQASNKSVEETFHDDWADQENLEAIDVIGANEALTAPELRYIHSRLGDTTGKTLLDVGCGLGEASVYFALQGASVTATDLSSGMLRATRALAESYGTTLNTHQASAEGMGFAEGTVFDVIYTGNLLHHVDVDATLEELDRYLAPGGTLVTWDPLAYNPVINVYRMMATDVRTPDEHPLKWADLKRFEAHFDTVHREYFWLTTLVIFIMMAVLERRNPNKERYWKSVIHEADRWAWLFNPLEKVDRFLLRFIPPLRLLCWNVVVFAKKA